MSLSSICVFKYPWNTQYYSILLPCWNHVAWPPYLTKSPPTPPPYGGGPFPPSLKSELVTLLKRPWNITETPMKLSWNTQEENAPQTPFAPNYRQGLPPGSEINKDSVTSSLLELLIKTKNKDERLGNYAKSFEHKHLYCP